MHAPHTPPNDGTAEGRKRARNTLRLRLWSDDALAHRWLCHPHRECYDGCAGEVEVPDYGNRLALYQTDIEE